MPAGEGSNGYKSLNFTGTGKDYPIYADIQKYLVDAGKNAGDGSSLGTVQYNRGLYAAMLAAEAARKAQEVSGKSDISSEDMRDGMEALEVTAERMAELGMPNFGPAVSVSCENHGGAGVALVQQWDASAQKWNAITDFIASDRDLIGKLIEEDSAAYATENSITPRDCN